MRSPTRSSPEDAKRYDTAELRRRYLIENVFSADEVNMTYTMHDRMIAGGAMPVGEILELKPIDILRADYFLERREIARITVSGARSGFSHPKTNKKVISGAKQPLLHPK